MMKTMNPIFLTHLLLMFQYSLHYVVIKVIIPSVI